MSSDELSRRRMLGRVGVGAAATAGLSSVVSAADPTVTTPKQAARRTELSKKAAKSADVRRNIVNKHASDLLSRLVKESYLSNASVNAFDIKSFNADRTELERRADWEGSAITTVETEEGDATLLMLSAYKADTHIRLFVQPEVSKSYAMVTEPGEDSGRLIRANGVSDDEVTTQCASCYDYTSCSDVPCYGCGTIDKQCTGKLNREKYNCYVTANCTCDCEKTGTECGCDFDCYC